MEEEIAKLEQEVVVFSRSFARLAKLALCHLHVGNAEDAQSQWYKEWKDTKGEHLSAKEHATQRRRQRLTLDIESRLRQTNVEDISHKGTSQDISEEDSSHDTSDKDASHDTSVDDASLDMSDEKFDDDSSDENISTLTTTTPSSPMTYRLFSPNASAQTIASNIFNILKTTPSKRVSSRGYVYIISLNDSSGLFKVGYSTKKTEQRMRSHEKCHGNIKLINDSKTAWAGRIESLVHAELMQYQHIQTRKCQCGVAHRELFSCGLKEIKESLYKWMDFFMDHPDPYNENGPFKKNVVLPKPYGGVDRASFTSTPTKSTRRGQDSFAKEAKKSPPKTPDNVAITEVTSAVKKFRFSE